MKTIKSLSLTIALYGFAGWVYVAGNAWIHPETLSLQLTHVTPWIREDSFGILCFTASAISFFIWRLLSDTKK